jgi:hypothetical protein
MTNSNSFKLIFKLSTLGILSICSWIFTSGAVTQSPKLAIENQPDSPLQISSFQIESTDLEISTRVTLMLKSTSIKPIRAFAITSSVGKGKTGVVLITTNTDEQMWQLNETRPIQIGKSRDEITSGIKLSIDFVEFADGSAWGPDSFDSADSLAGERAGLRASLQPLTEILKTKGFSGLMQSVSSTISNIPIPEGRSLSWERGFQRGAGKVLERLNRAYKKGGQEQLKAEWERAVDDSERIPPQ